MRHPVLLAILIPHWNLAVLLLSVQEFVSVPLVNRLQLLLLEEPLAPQLTVQQEIRVLPLPVLYH